MSANAAQAVKDAKSAGISTQSVGGAASGSVAGSTGAGAIVEGGLNGTAGAANGSGSYGAGSYGTPGTGGGRGVASTKGGVNYRTASVEGRPSGCCRPVWSEPVQNFN